ncbi:MAG: urea ABC transporter ATP-binding subunit UrtE [Methylophilaceae bacterium]|nr:urea ABC transporter ATP-binding subunit UrtE [Methylophilaceae bacterium]
MLEVKNINQFYGGSQILRDVSLSAAMGACSVLLGRNGVGKTTLLKCLMGVLPVKSGQIFLDGKDITTLKPYVRASLGMAYVPQGREIFSRLTVEENILMGLAVVKGKAASRIPDDIFEMFPVLAEMLHRRGGDLSGGQQQQLAIARALVSRPKLLILDEPTEGIQPSIIKDIERVIKMLAQRGEMAILLVEQYYDFAEALADHYMVMSRGQIVKNGLGKAMQADNIRNFVAL